MVSWSRRPLTVSLITRARPSTESGTRNRYPRPSRCPSRSLTDCKMELAHVAFKVGSSLEVFGLARRLLDESGTPVPYEARRGFSRSVHVLDPDGNEIELYVDISGDCPDGSPEGSGVG